MLVVDMTSEFKKQYPNIDNYQPTSEDAIMRGVSEVISGIGNISPYSGGTVGGLFEGTYDVNK